MNIDSDWNPDRPSRSVGKAGMGVLRIALLFGSAAIALALFATPYLTDNSRQIAVGTGFGGLDLMSTGSVGSSTYTIRRSVLQTSPDAVCIILDSGVRRGDC